jgi:hypothetical protein
MLAARLAAFATTAHRRRHFFHRTQKIIPLREVWPRVFLKSSRRPAADRIERPLLKQGALDRKAKGGRANQSAG